MLLAPGKEGTVQSHKVSRVLSYDHACLRLCPSKQIRIWAASQYRHPRGGTLCYRLDIIAAALELLGYSRWEMLIKEDFERHEESSFTP